jgi:hypothetical protein
VPPPPEAAPAAPASASASAAAPAPALVLLQGDAAREEATRRLLALLPFCVPFHVRAERCERLRSEARRAAQEGMPQVRVTVQRARLLESALAGLRDVRGERMRRKVHVAFVNDEGLPEAGIDAGGLFKELWTQLAALCFDARYGLWLETEHGRELYPNPSSALCTGFGDAEAFELLGRVLGKALFEGITVGPQFARFFLTVLCGRAVTLHHLPSLDAELYKSLMFLKQYEGDVEGDLCLTFTTSDELGGGGGGGGAGGERELVPGGAAMAVTNANRHSYIHLLADFRLRGSIRRQTGAFLEGLRDVLPAAWLAPFSAPELQVLISGSLAGIDVADLKANSRCECGAAHIAARSISHALVRARTHSDPRSPRPAQTQTATAASTAASATSGRSSRPSASRTAPRCCASSRPARARRRSASGSWTRPSPLCAWPCAPTPRRCRARAPASARSSCRPTAALPSCATSCCSQSTAELASRTRKKRRSPH